MPDTTPPSARRQRYVIEFAAYPIKAFLDANIILQGRPLADLPWSEIDPEGPILALLTPQALQEIDTKKRDGRLGQHARAFNQLATPVAVSGVPLVLRHAHPRVELALALSNKIPWGNYDALDPDDGDSKIVAEALHARGVGDEGKILVSHDLKPIALASLHGLPVLRVGDAWLRPDEPGPKDKEITRLKQRVRELETTSPSFEIAFSYNQTQSDRFIAVAPLTSEERYAVRERVMDAHPRPANGIRVGPNIVLDDDSSFGGRWNHYSETVLPGFIDGFQTKMELAFNQREITVVVRNVGAIRAESATIELKTSEGWIHDRIVFVVPVGPDGPEPRPFHMRTFMSDLQASRVARHEFEFIEAPRREETIVATCEDFRHGAEWRFEGVILPDPGNSAPFTLTVRVTAGNLRGDVTDVFTLPKEIQAKSVSDLVDLNTLKYIDLPEILIAHSGEKDRAERYEIDGTGDDD